jgi:putative ABC transport system permease protein
MFGGRAAARSQVIKIYGLEFTVVGTFHEKVETFGQSEVERDTILIPITVLRYFNPGGADRIRCMCRCVRRRRWIAWRRGCRRFWRRGNRPGARYRVDTLTAILNAAKNISLNSLAGAGAGFRDHAADFRHWDHEHMLVTVTERTREIGVRWRWGRRPRRFSCNS